MKQLILIKEKIKQFVGRFDVYIIPLLKFLLTYIVLRQINSGLGFMQRITSSPITLIIALAGSFLPLNLTIVLLALIVVLHVYALSMECAIIVLALFLILFLLYFRFAAKDSVAVMLTPVAFAFKIPYVIPVSMGLVSSPSSVASVGSGVIVYNVLHYISVNADDIKNLGNAGSKIGAVKDITTALLGNREMLVYILAFSVAIVFVHIISRLSIDYSWQIAIGVGSLLQFLMIMVGNSVFKGQVSVGNAFLGMIISIIINIILQFFCFNLDYNRTEKVQFEDDEYYYYVKAVPKNTVELPEKGKKKKPSGKKPTGKKPGHRPDQKPLRQTEGIKPQPERRPTPKFSDETGTVKVPARTPSARETVQRTAARKAKAVDKGFLGLTGGRPAGEGRLKEQRVKEQQASESRRAAREIVDDFTNKDF